MTSIPNSASYLTPNELIAKYPEVTKRLNWDARELGLFLKCKLLEGYYDRGRRAAMIRESSFIILVNYVNESLENQKIIL